MKYEAIDQNSSEFSVGKMCQILGLDPSNYYRWKKRETKRLEKRKEVQELVHQIEKIFLESDRTYGYRVIKEALKQEGLEISEYTVRRIMRENGMYPETKKKYRPFKGVKGDGRYQEDLLKQKFTTSQPDQVWTGDITYIKTGIGWISLAVVMDLYNREVIGYALSKKIDTELVKAALSNAIGRHGSKEGLLFHSDRVSQYASKGYQKMLEENGIMGSMSRAGCPYDNSCTESFFATLKKERIYRREYATMEEVRADMFRYIELFYNRKRLHSVLGYMSPIDYRIKYKDKTVA